MSTQPPSEPPSEPPPHPDRGGEPPRDWPPPGGYPSPSEPSPPPSYPPPGGPTQPPGGYPPPGGPGQPPGGYPPPGGPGQPPGGYPPPGGGGGYPPPGGPGQPPGGFPPPGGYVPPGGAGYPPPAGYPPAATPGSSFDIGAAFSYAWRKFTAAPGPLLVCTLVIVVVNLVFAAISYPIEGFVARLLLNVISFVVGLVLSRGLIRAALTVVNGGTPDPGLVFRFDNLGPYAVVSILFGLIVFVGLLLCIIPGIILAGLFGFAPWLVVERDMDGVAALGAARNLVSGHLGSVILFGVCFIGLNIVGAILCGVGLLVTYPVSYLAAAHAYRQLTGTPIAP